MTTTTVDPYDIEYTAEQIAEMQALEESGYWDVIESGRFEVGYRSLPQQQVCHYTGDFSTRDEAAAKAETLRANGLLSPIVIPIYIYRGTGEVVGG